jgi:hypothetical protein
MCSGVLFWRFRDRRLKLFQELPESMVGNGKQFFWGPSGWELFPRSDDAQCMSPGMPAISRRPRTVSGATTTPHSSLPSDLHRSASLKYLSSLYAPLPAGVPPGKYSLQVMRCRRKRRKAKQQRSTRAALILLPARVLCMKCEEGAKQYSKSSSPPFPRAPVSSKTKTDRRRRRRHRKTPSRRH